MTDMTQNDLKSALERMIDEGWSQNRIAKESGVNQSTISRIMAGKGCRVATYLLLIQFVSDKSKQAA